MRKTIHRSSLILMVIMILTSGLSAQTYYYFQDSPSNEYYDFSWMELTAPSELERMGTESHKFPVESTIVAEQGSNSLRLKWKSVSGGNWVAIAAASNWAANDISDADTLLFFLRSEVGFSKNLLPKIFMEDVTNKKSDFHLISNWTDDLKAQEWTKIKIPMSQFFDANDGLDWTQVKTIGFTQNETDGAEHMLFIDDMRVIKGATVALPASAPTGFSVEAYDSHFEIHWDINTEENLQGYRLEKSTNNDEDFVYLAEVDSKTSSYMDWVGSNESPIAASYRVRALNAANEASEPSSLVEASTHAFTDDEFLDMVQEYTFRYFWDFGHEVSGLARERNTSGNTVTSGGSGFGLMSIPVGIERGFISREEGAERVLKILNFLDYAERYHGAWPHWLHGESGVTIPFSTFDNGGDLVETAFVAQGLLAIRQYFSENTSTETDIVETATRLWEEIEWDWYRKNNSNALYWHWSPDYDWQMNMKVSGWNEAAIVYLLAIASPTHGVPASLWESGWVGDNYVNPRTAFGYTLKIGQNYGGPMFFAHYSFLGFNPNNIADAYTNYFDHNRNQALIQQAYCAANPKGFSGYSSDCWGLTASDDPDGYLAHEPNSTRDNGTISPTAALASIPYTPEESMKALKHFYRNLGENVWGPMGFYDAFNETRSWYANSYLAIDQGPIILMIENYRSQLLWDLFMSNEEIAPMLEAIGFVESPNKISKYKTNANVKIYPNPSKSGPIIEFDLQEDEEVMISIYDITGRKIETRKNVYYLLKGKQQIDLRNMKLTEGIYFVNIRTDTNKTINKKFIIHL